MLIRKDGKPIRYLVVDDSVFARKNVAKMVEAFGGEIVGEAGDGCTAITEYDRTTPDMLMDTPCRKWKGLRRRAHVRRIGCAHRHGFFRGYQENIVAAAKGARHCPEKSVGDPLRSHQVRMGDNAPYHATPGKLSDED
jgi:CheY-like chemotaxis protein